MSLLCPVPQDLSVMQTLYYGVFMFFFYLSRYWQNNDIQTVDAKAFVSLKNSLEEVYLQNNKMTWFPALQNLQKLKKLDVSNNQIETLGYNAFSTFDPKTLTHL